MVKKFLSDVKVLTELPILNKFQNLFLSEYPFDRQLLSLSPLYRESRQAYLKIGGKFTPSVCSTLRSLTTHDLLKNDIEFTPAQSEMMWLYENASHMSDAEEQIKAVKHFHDISIFHEQNHRIVWSLLPPAPIDKDNLSLVVSLDLALADQVGPELSKVFERMCLLYRPAGPVNLGKLSKKEYRQYLISSFCSTYFALERMRNHDVLKAVNYVLPKNKEFNKQAVARGLELNVDFTEVTNPQWQELYWQSSAMKLKAMHQNSKKPVLFLPADPLDLDTEFKLAERIFDYFEA